jgi:1-acyl-sn-glycerol-3-phosphate acyltransferase
MGHVFIDRKDRGGATKAIQGRIERGLRGASLFFFAEGTRSVADELLPFKKGAAVAAIETGLDCVPIAVAGARTVLKPKGFSLFQPGPVAVVLGEPISAAGHALERRDALVAEQRAAVQRSLEEARALLPTPRAG